MAESDMDTDTMLVMLSSLLHPQEFGQDVLLEALVKSKGDIEAAAKSLQTEPPRKRRKVSDRVSIDSWLKGEGASSSSPSDSASTSRKDNVAALPASLNAVAGGSSGRRASTPVSPPKPSASEQDSASSRRASSPQKPTSKIKNITNDELMALLRPPNSSDGSGSKPHVPRLLPLTLTTPEMVAEHTPCTLHHSVLPPELACRLYYTLLYASRDWQRTKWWLADRIVESSHSSFFYRRGTTGADSEPESDMTEAAQYWYNGRPTEAPPVFPPAMEEACQIVERVVNAEMRKRRRFPLEWGGYPVDENGESLLWRANVAASNCYAGAKESVGFHSDQLTYLGPYPTIASLSLGVSRIFRLREVVPLDERDKRAARTYNIPLRHNSLIIMHASTQEVYKHAVPPQNSIDIFRPSFPPPPSLTDDKEVLAKLHEASNARINVTFRFYRPDFHSSKTPRCKCGVPCILRPDMKNRYEELPATNPGPQMNTTGGSTSSTSKPESSARKKTMVAKYWWTCYAGAQNDGKGCGLWRVMDVKAEGRGPFVGDVTSMENQA